MSEYMLKDAVPDEVLRKLNVNFGPTAQNIFLAVDEFNAYPDMDELEDWIAAIKSGKNIVNPLSPRKELRMYLEDILHGKKHGITRYEIAFQTAEIIAKEHPDVKDWLEQDDDKVDRRTKLEKIRDDDYD
jgi:hypothetical protein